MSMPRFGRVQDLQGRIYTPQRAFVNAAAGATTAVVAAVALKKIAVLGYRLNAGADATTLTFVSDPTSGDNTAIDFLHSCAANALMGHNINPSAEPLFITKPGEGLSVTLGAGSAIGVAVIYIVIDN